MANSDAELAAREAITAKIVEMTNRMTPDGSASYNRDLAAAVCLLAEANAWLVVKNQPHGGLTVNAN